tara:strand:+ start:9857 stop:10453 length:597 start_codon:yes stop_codon:yes gene_type:complete
MLHAMDGLANAPDDDHLWELAEQLAQGDIVSCRTLMSTLGCPAPEIVWSPLAGQLRAEPLWKTLEWWQALPRRKLLPDPGQINPFDLKESLGVVSLLDVQQGGQDFRYRLYGTQTSEAADMEHTNKMVSMIDTPMRAFFLLGYRAVMKRQQPLFTLHTPPYHVRASGWLRLILPFASGAQVDRLLVVIVACEPQPITA